MSDVFFFLVLFCSLKNFQRAECIYFWFKEIAKSMSRMEQKVYKNRIYFSFSFFLFLSSIDCFFFLLMDFQLCNISFSANKLQKANRSVWAVKDEIAIDFFSALCLWLVFSFYTVSVKNSDTYSGHRFLTCFFFVFFPFLMAATLLWLQHWNWKWPIFAFALNISLYNFKWRIFGSKRIGDQIDDLIVTKLNGWQQ